MTLIERSHERKYAQTVEQWLATGLTSDEMIDRLQKWGVSREDVKICYKRVNPKLLGTEEIAGNAGFKKLMDILYSRGCLHSYNFAMQALCSWHILFGRVKSK